MGSYSHRYMGDDHHARVGVNRYRTRFFSNREGLNNHLSSKINKTERIALFVADDSNAHIHLGFK